MLAPTGADELLETLAHGDAGLADAVRLLLRGDRAHTLALLGAVADGARAIVARADRVDALAARERAERAEQGVEAEPDEAPEEDRTRELNDAAAVLRLARLALDLQERFPGDAGTLVALLLEDADLAPGETLYVAPGTPHAYLEGLGLEVMACSDNVLRGGMTVKPVDVEAFLAVLDPRAIGMPRVGTLPRRHAGSGWQRTITPTDAFVLDEAEVDGVLGVERSGLGPAILLCVEGAVTLRAEDGSAVALQPGGAALLSSGREPVEVRGRGLVLHAMVGRVPAARGASEVQPSA